MLKVIEKLLILGVEVIGIPCNTSHAPEIFGRVKRAVMSQCPRVRLIHLPTEVVRIIGEKQPPKCRIGLMATNGTCHSKIYQQLLGQSGYQAIVPPMDLQEQIVDRLIYDKKIGIKANSVDPTREAVSLWHKALDFFRLEQVNTIILGCTELSLIHHRHPEDGLTFIDTTDVLARALIREATQPT